MDETNQFTEVIENLKFPTCPSCKSKRVSVSGSHAACLGGCKWIGASIPLTKKNVLLRCLMAQEGFSNLSSTIPGGIKSIAIGIAKKNDFPTMKDGASIHEMGVARCFIPKVNEFGEESDIQEFMESSTVDSFRLSVFNFMERVASATACAMGSSGTKSLRKFASGRIAIAPIKEDDSNLFLLDNGKVNPALFRKKSAIEVDNRDSDEFFTDVKIYSSSYGRPDCTFHGKYTKTGALIPQEYPTMTISRYDAIWQPFYWPAINLASDNLIRLAGVIQGGSENLTYIITENMDNGQFSAGVYRRGVYESDATFIPSKAENVNDAISRLKSSFEKSILRNEKEGKLLDFSWIQDWSDEHNHQASFCSILAAPFWDESIAAEMLHLIGSSKNQILKEMYQEIPQ